MSTDLNADFQRAAGLDEQKKTQQKAQQSAAECGSKAMTGKQASDKETPEIIDDVTRAHSRATADNSIEWAIQDSNILSQA